MVDSQAEGYNYLKGAIDFCQSSKAHYRELSQYLIFYLAKKVTSEPDYRAGARRSLPRLTVRQFHELSTDCYEELLRRTRVGHKRSLSHPSGSYVADLPTSLPIREDMHPRRNTARQKLATFTDERFQDLLSDIHFELVRRYPEFKQE